jgi:broad specificity phosphatase PhoE
MGIFSKKNTRGRFVRSLLSFSVILSALLVACGDDSVNALPDFSKNESDSSSSEEVVKSSSSVSKKTHSSSSVSEKKLSSSSSQEEIQLEDSLDVIYAIWNGNVSGVVGLDGYTSAKKVKMVELDSADDYDETKNVLSAEIGKNGAYEFKKVNLVQPFVRVSAEVTLTNPIDGKSYPITFSALGDVSSNEKFNLGLLTTLETERALVLLAGKDKLSFEAAKSKAAEDVWNMFHLESLDFDQTETIDVSKASESGTALVAATILSQLAAGSELLDDYDFVGTFKAIVADVAKDGKWDDEKTRLRAADNALGLKISGGYENTFANVKERFPKNEGFDKYLTNFALKELEFPECDGSSAGEIFFVKNKASSLFYAESYDDQKHSLYRFVCDEKKGWELIPDSLKDFIGDKTPAKDGEVRRGAYSGKFFTYDAAKKEWREATAVEKDRYFVLESNAKEFVDIQDVYESIKDDERVIFVLRHAERGDDTSKGGTLTDNGKKQSEEVGARLTKFKEDFVLGASEFLRAHQTVESIAKGRGQSYDKRDTIPQLNDDWYAKNSEAVEKAKNECGGGWEVTSKYAYTGAYSTGADAAYYDLAERSVELIEDVLVKKYPTEKFVLLSSHDKLMVPLVAYCTNLQVELKKYDGGKWINYLAGVAIIIDKDGNRRYVAIRGLKSGYAN